MNTFIQITTIGYALISSIFLISSSIVNTPNRIVSMFSLNRDSKLIYNDCAQRALAIVGTGFILLSFIFGMWQSLISLTWNDLDFNICGFVSGMTLLVFSVLAGLYILIYLKQKFYNQTKKLFSEIAVHIEDYEIITK